MSRKMQLKQEIQELRRKKLLAKQEKEKQKKMKLEMEQQEKERQRHLEIQRQQQEQQRKTLQAQQSEQQQQQQYQTLRRKNQQPPVISTTQNKQQTPRPSKMDLNPTEAKTKTEQQEKIETHVQGEDQGQCVKKEVVSNVSESQPRPPSQQQQQNRPPHRVQQLNTQEGEKKDDAAATIGPSQVKHEVKHEEIQQTVKTEEVHSHHLQQHPHQQHLLQQQSKYLQELHEWHLKRAQYQREQIQFEIAMQTWVQQEQQQRQRQQQVQEMHHLHQYGHQQNPIPQRIPCIAELAMQAWAQREHQHLDQLQQMIPPGHPSHYDLERDRTLLPTRRSYNFSLQPPSPPIPPPLPPQAPSSVYPGSFPSLSNSAAKQQVGRQSHHPSQPSTATKTCPRNSGSSAPAKKKEIFLCSPMEPPSPFAQQNRELLTIKLVRKVDTEPSYGVSLNLYKMSALVDAKWVLDKEQERQERKRKQHEHLQQTSSSVVAPATTLPDSVAATSNGIESGTAESTKEHGNNPTVIASIKTEGATDALSSPSAQSSSIVQSQGPVKHQRRRRVDFPVIYVTDATRQNSRKPKATQKDLLETGDIVISIGGCNVADMAFEDACSLFAKKSQKTHDIMQVEIVVGRKKVVQIPPKTSLSLSSVHSFPSERPENTSMSFLSIEVAFLIDSLRQAMEDRSRVLGGPIDHTILHRRTDIFRQRSLLPGKTLSIAHRGLSTLQTKWNQMSRLKDFALAQKGKEFWLKTFVAEYSEDAVQSLPFRTEAERVALRNLPRPAKGCRCGLQDHEYVFDPKCSLYTNVRNRLSSTELDTILSRPSIDKKTKNSSSAASNLGTVGSAYLNRIVKQKQESESEEAEARFVDSMEQMEAKELKKAVFAPSFLSSIILSTIFELQREFPISSISPADESDVGGLEKKQKQEETDESTNKDTGDNMEDDDDEDDDDDDDDVPLALLGKRGSRDNKKEEQNKRPKMDIEWRPKFNLQYLVRMLEYISKTWGHCFRELSHRDYAWRWEVFQGAFTDQTPEQQGSRTTRNPRRPNSLPFENVRFGVSEILSPKDKGGIKVISDIPSMLNSHKTALLAHLQVANDSNTSLPGSVTSSLTNQPQPTQTSVSVSTPKQETVLAPTAAPTFQLEEEALNKYSTLIYLISPSCTGLYDELQALLRMEVVEVRNDGIPVLTNDWVSNIDHLILEDMDESWSCDSDPDGKYCINDEFRDMLEENWEKTLFGWSFQGELIYSLADLDGWRESYEGQEEERANKTHGIGRFGL